MPEGGVKASELFGITPDYLEQLRSNFRRLAEEANLPIGDFDFVAHTKLPLMIGEVAKEQGVHDPYHRAVFRAYWEKGDNIGEWEVLEPIMAQVGLNFSARDLSARYAELEAVMQTSFEHGRRLGISGIPTFIIGNRGLVGAHPYATLKQMAEETLGE